MLGKKLTGSTGFVFSNIDESSSAAALKLGMVDIDCGFTKQRLR
jgi:hypothetical protein